MQVQFAGRAVEAELQYEREVEDTFIQDACWTASGLPLSEVCLIHLQNCLVEANTLQEAWAEEMCARAEAWAEQDR
jgi:hypothetical protein